MLDKHVSKRSHAIATLNEEKERLAAAQKQVEDTLTAQQAIQQLAQFVQQKSHEQIAKIVSRCLSAVFPDPYQMKIEFVRLRGKTEAKLHYWKDGHEVDPLRTSGGVLDVSALGLRTAQLMLSSPQCRKFLVLDEPMKGVDAVNLPKVASLIETLSKEMGIQFLIITHNEALEVGKVYRL
jgi:DNA repair exonuclease SbcCD ATPase subunit